MLGKGKIFAFSWVRKSLRHTENCRIEGYSHYLLWSSSTCRLTIFIPFIAMGVNSILNFFDDSIIKKPKNLKSNRQTLKVNL